jgi:hypothetical protein
MLSRMDEQPVSEILPGLYRAVLDAVADLESRGRRREAAAIRAEGTRVYSHAWNAEAARRLRLLVARASRVPGARPRTRYDAVLEALGRLADLERRPA